jgi:cold shock CspA family protein
MKFTPDAADRSIVFVQFSAIAGSGFRMVKGGELVEFERIDGPMGYQALRVSTLSEDGTQIFDR